MMSSPYLKQRTRPAFALTGGFTLIELVVVIAVIGLLAATALPRFIDVRTNARLSSMRAAMGATQSAAKLFKSKCVVTGGTCDTVEMENAQVTGVNSYPTADAAGITLAASLSANDFTFAGGGSAAGQTITISVPSPSNACSFSYTAPAAADSTPTVTVVASACN